MCHGTVAKNLPNSSCNFPNDKPVFHQNLHHSSVSWKMSSLYFLRCNIKYFGQKDTIKKNIFENFECSRWYSWNSEVYKFRFNGILLSKLYEVWAKKTKKNYISWYWTVMQNFNRPWPCCFKISTRNWMTLLARLFLSILKTQICFSLNFSSPFSAIKNNSSVLF